MIMHFLQILVTTCDFFSNINDYKYFDVRIRCTNNIVN